MATRIVRTLFVVASIVMGGLWANYLVTQINDMLLTEPIQKAVIQQQVPGADPSATGEIQTKTIYLPSTVPPKQVPFWVTLGCIAGGLTAIAIMFLLKLVKQETFERLFPAIVALALAIITGYLLSVYVLLWWPVDDTNIKIFFQTTLILIFGFIGVSVGLTRVSSFETLVKAVKSKQLLMTNPKLIDTSVIIDGRIADVCRTGFLEGTLLVPRFILRELQNIADSSDMIRRARGRRGLDILKSIQHGDSPVRIEVIEDDPEQHRDVDGKLVALAREYGAKILTNDINLYKVAEIEGVPVLNINDLANALKTAVLPDEQMQVKIIREGKEPQQGVGYLDDGTMVVVDGGKEYIGRSVAANVTSVLQTSNGRMIFTKLQSVLE